METKTNSNNIRNKNERETLFDSLKGIAMLGVILTHSGAAELPGLLGQISAFGARGVQMFFIISAILTFHSLESLENDKKSIKNWYFNKFLRLIPLYYISLIFYYCTIGFKPNYWTGNQPINVITICLNILLLHGLNPWYINAINVNWYIGTLTLFIIIAPLLYKRINNLSKSILFFSVSWIIALVAQIILTKFYVGEDVYIWSAYWSNFSLISELPVIALGIILYYLIYKENIIKTLRNKMIKLEKPKVVMNILTFCIFLCLGEKIIYNASLISYSILFGVLIFIQMLNSNSLIDNKIFAFLGRNSYCIYLFHYPIINILTNLYSKYILNKYILIVIVIWSTIILCTIISCIFAKIIEKPIISKLKK